MRIRRVLVILLLVFVSTILALAQTDDAKQCSKTADKDPDLGIQYCTAAIHEASQLSSQSLAACYFNLGLAYYEKSDYDNALTNASHAVTMLPNNEEVLMLRGAIYEEKGNDELAIADFKAAVQADSTQLDPYLGLSEAYAEEHQYDQAIAAASEALTHAPNSTRAYYDRSHAYLYKMDYSDARKDVQKAITLAPDKYNLYTERADLEEYLGEWDDVYADYAKAIQLAPAKGRPYADRAWAEWAQGGENDGKAMADADKALLLNPSSATTMRLKATIYFYQKDYQAALSNMEEAVEKQPHSAYDVLWLHIIRLRDGNNDQVEFARNAAALDLTKWPGPIVNYYLGKITRQQVLSQINSPEASEALVRHCESDFYLGEYDLAHGNKTEAAKYFHRVMNSCPVPYVEHSAAREELELLPKPRPATHRAGGAKGA